VLSEALFEIVGMSCVVAAIGAVEDINPKRHLVVSRCNGANLSLLALSLAKDISHTGGTIGFDKLSLNGLGSF
jgi:hypothetical protein